MSGLLVISIKVIYVRLVRLVVRKSFFHVGNQHAELGAPVSHVISPDHVVVHVLQHSADRLSDNGASEMTHMHLFGNIWRGEVNHDFLLGNLRESQTVHEVIDPVFNELVLQLDFEESFIVGSD